jgi:hypothetical protein
MSRIPSILLAVSLVVWPGCQGPELYVSVEDMGVRLTPGQTHLFTVSVSGANNLAVAWSATGGSITEEGLYTAPAEEGVYRVRATSVEDASRYAEAPVEVKALPAVSLTATSQRLRRCESTTLRWEVSGATQVRLEPPVGELTGSNLVVSPLETTTYTLVAENDMGSTRASLTVEVEQPRGDWEPMHWSHEHPLGYDSDVYRWLDADKLPRTAVLTRNSHMDPGGSHGGMLRQFRFHAGGTERVATGTGVRSRWNGWGYVVSHYDNLVARSADVSGTFRQALRGRHHTVHEFSWVLSMYPTPVKATVHWLLATGRDYPVYAITYDTSAAGPAGLAVAADSRAPYGDIAWDGDGTHALVDGVGWGDKYRFVSLDEPLTAQSRWDYSQPNVVPYALSWSRQADAEMGAVQTLDWVHQNAGGSWLTNNWGRTYAQRVDAGQFGSWLMPPNWNWPFQICQYEMDDRHPTSSKRLAWGLMYGAVGKPSYWGYGYQSRLSGHPYQSYSVYMVMGQHSKGEVLGQVAQVEHMLKARLQAARGQLLSQGPGGVARSDSVRYPVAGYNSIYGTYELQADASGAFELGMEAVGGAIENPVFRVHGLGGVPACLMLDGKALAVDEDYFASYDEQERTLWLTLRRTWSGGHTLSGGPEPTGR